MASLLFFLKNQVTRDTHLYLRDIEEREEGGTPAIVESIRAGMVFQLKQVMIELYKLCIQRVVTVIYLTVLRKRNMITTKQRI